jgi:hypothetical protein
LTRQHDNPADLAKDAPSTIRENSASKPSSNHSMRRAVLGRAGDTGRVPGEGGSTSHGIRQDPAERRGFAKTWPPMGRRLRHR